MWVDRKLYTELHKQLEQQTKDAQLQTTHAHGQLMRLTIENERLRADMDWFKLRLNQVERERGQLIQAAIGVKIAVPEFVPTYEDPAEALNQMPDLSTVGEDALEPSDAEASEGVDYSMMPGYRGKG